MAITINIAPEKVVLTGNPVWYELQSSLAHPIIYIHCIAEVYISGVWLSASTIEDKVECNASGTAIFKIQALLNKHITQKFTFPESDTQMMVTQPGMSVQFRVKYKESWIDSGGTAGESVSFTTESSTHYGIKGGVPNELLAIYNTAQTWWWSEMTLNKQFSTWQPRTDKNIYPTSIEKLYWVQRRTATESLKIEWTGTDATTGTITKTNYATAWSVVELSVSPALVEYLAGKPVATYKVYLSGQSEERIYTVNRNYFERADNLIVDNSLGCFDCLTAVGWRKETGQNERESYNKQLPLIPELTDRSIQNHRATRKDVSEINTGFLLSKSWLEYMREIDLARDAYLLEGTLSRAINIETEEGVTINDDHNFMLQYLVKWSFAHKNQYSGRFYGALRSPLPPYFTYAVAMFDRRVGTKLIDKINGVEAVIDTTGVTFPTLSPDVFNKTNATYWGGTIPNTAGNNRKWLFAELNWEFMVDYATDAAHGTLFLKDFGSDVRSTLPIIVYSPARSEAEQTEIVKYLNSYSFIVDNSGAIILDPDGAYIVDGTI